MVEPRKRDRIWTFTLKRCVTDDGMTTPQEIAELADVSERSARETLNIISKTDYVNRELANDGTVRFVGSDLIEFLG
jgi:Mn-dependent DtxR family transcriptional regulator